MPGTFISYARDDDEAFVLELYKRLRKKKVTVWWDREKMESRGRTFLQEIRDAIAACERVVLVVGPRAIASDYVRVEWQFALEMCKVVVPILRLGNTIDVPRELAKDDYLLLPGELAKLHCPDFRDDRKFEAALAGLTRILRATIPALAPLHGVEALPAHFLPRPEAIAALARTVLEDTVAPTVITSAKQTAALQGMGGVGKSVLAAAFAHACATRRACGDGIVWLRAGQQPALPLLGAALARALGEEKTAAAIEATGQLTGLQSAIAGKNCLVVLDDVWSAAHVAPFRNALGTRGRLLVTSRDAALMTTLEAREHRVDVLSDADALTMIAEWSAQDARSLPPDAHDAMRKCGGLPLALAMVGAMARGKPERWPGIVERLRRADLDRIQAEFPNYPYPNLLSAIEVSVDALDGDVRTRYLELAVFPPALPVPVAVLRRLWAPSGMAALDADDAIVLIVDRSLARRDERGRIVLHDLQADFVRRRTPSARALHDRLLASYAKECSDGWATGPDDGYFLDQLAYHLVQAERREELVALVTSFDWIERRLTTGSLAALYRDYDACGDAPDATRVRAALRRAAQALQSNPSELAGQLLARIDPVADPALLPLLDRARARPKPPWLRPVRASLASNRSLLTLSGHEGTPRTVAIAPSGRWAISAGNSAPDGTVRVWDLDAGNEAACFAGQAEPGARTPIALTPDGRFALSALRSAINVWNVARAERVATLSGHDATVTAIAVDLEGTRVVSGDESGVVITWDAAAWQEIDRPVRGATAVRALATSPDGTHAAAAFDKTIEIWNLQTAASVASVTLDEAFPQRWQYPVLSLSADGRRVYFGSPLYEWSTASADPPALQADVYELDTILAVSADGATVVGTEDGYAITVRDRRTAATHIIPAQPMTIAAAALTPDGTRLAVSYLDHQVLIWELGRRVGLPSTPSRGVPVTMRMAPDGSTARVWYQEGAPAIWRLADGALLDNDASAETPASDASASPHEPAIVADVRKLIERGNTAGRLFARKSRGGRVRSIRGHHAGQVLVVERTIHKVSEAAEPAAASKESRRYGVEIISRKAGARDLSTRRLGGHASPVTSARFTPDGALVVSASLGRLIRVWDVASGTELFALAGHRGIIRQVVVTPDSRYAVSVSDDRTVRAWDLHAKAETARFTADAAMIACGITPDGRTVAALDSSGIVHALAFESSHG